MHRIFKLNVAIVFVLLMFVNLVCVGLGMGVPFFCILFGFPVGWYFAMREIVSSTAASSALKRPFSRAMLLALFTFVVMAVLWGPTLKMLFDPQADLENFGIPMILYQPTASFIGWIVLMVFISPALQLAASIFAAYVTLMFGWSGKELR